MLGTFSHFFLSSADFFQNQLFQAILSETQSEYQTIWIQIRTDFICKGYQQTTKFAAGRQNCKMLSRPPILFLFSILLQIISAAYILQQTTISNFVAFSKITNKAWYFMRIVCWQTILMKYHPLFFSNIKKDVAKFAVCCSRDWPFKG